MLGTLRMSSTSANVRSTTISSPPACPQGCEKCSSFYSCSSCKKGFYLSSKKCIKCPPNCASCTSSNQCTECERGYGLSNGICLSCNDITCTTCQDGTYFDTYSSRCKPCYPTCTTCNSYFSCTSCADGYFRQQTTLTCLPCSQKIDGCTSCSFDGSTCYNCSQWYRLSSGTCVSLCFT